LDAILQTIPPLFRSLCQIMPSHPYTNLPKHAFWKTAVADLDSRQIDLAWKPKAPITRATKIITVGSCFAQHISKSLKENGFSWIDSEPAPAALPQAEHAKNGYGIFSFRTGNIYTAALLKQWVMWATGKAEQSTESFLDDGRYYDPFRPSVTEDGFSSAEEMLSARQTTLAAMLEAIKQADVFVFTLGLTEAWLNKDGFVYPMCPGTIKGTFSPENHIFHNYNDMEVVTDLADTFDALRSINPNLRFLLTVSPVPLTATASGEHVLTATTYSKAVLRSAAGYFTQMIGDTEYFPSYELITAPVFKGQFFEKNMRSVTSEGVTFVMGQFFKAIGVVSVVATPDISLVAKEVISSVFETTESGADICDDIILETWSNKPIDDAEESPNILLIGDSHMGMIAKVLDEQHIRYAGGATMNSSDWHALRFDLDEEKLFLPHNPEQKARWESTYYASFAKSMPSSGKPIIITDVGLHRNDVPSKDFFEYLDQIYGPGPHNHVDANHLHHYLLMSRRTHLALLCKFMARGYSVLVVTEPPSEPMMIDLCTMIDSFFCDFYRSVGFSVFSARDWIKELGGMPQEFRSTVINELTKKHDHIHGSPEYYRQLTKEIFSRFSVTPQYR
jgi:hypothetical protein